VPDPRAQRHRTGARSGPGPARAGLVPAGDLRMTSVLIEASNVKRREDDAAALSNLDFTADERAEIDRYAVADVGIDPRAPSSDG
jgi:hypothetical protein